MIYRSRLHLCFEEGEALYGLGQSEEGVLNLRGHIRYLHQANRKIAIPVLMSSKGYGLFFPSGSAGIFCDNEYGTYFQTEADEMLEYYFLGGDSLDESISMFRYLTGKATLLPRWAYGYLQSKERYENEEELLEIADEFRSRNIGIDALILDWLTWEDNMWGQKTLDKKRFPDTDSMMKKLHDKNINLMISIWPNMTEQCDNHKEFKDNNLLCPGTNVYNALSRKCSDHRVMNLTRNGYPGSQSLGTVMWSGDIGASFDTLRRQVAEGLNLCASGLPYWTIDIGAFFVKRGAPWFWEGHYPEGLDNMGYRELYVRWYQYGAFLPVFRSHGTDCPREPWRFGEEGDMFYDAIIRANELRYKLMPYIYSVAYKVWRDDYTMMRSLISLMCKRHARYISLRDLNGMILEAMKCMKAEAMRR